MFWLGADYVGQGKQIRRFPELQTKRYTDIGTAGTCTISAGILQSKDH